MKFVKMHGLGNDFIVIENFNGQFLNYAALARDLCRRRFNVGADGLLVLLPSACPEIGSFRMRIFNSDGSEAEMCGNGIRCVAKYLYERGYEKEKDFSIETNAGIKRVYCTVRGGHVISVKVNMDLPRWGEGYPERVGQEIVAGGISGRELFQILDLGKTRVEGISLSIGNPHFVVFVDNVDEIPLNRLGSAISTHPCFAMGSNVEFAQFKKPDTIKVRVWERGVGETMACGSGACAVGVASILLGNRSSKINLELPGGVLCIEWEGKGDVFMEGPVEEVFVGEIAEISG